ncbi:hypothetical protein B0H21DRAFT_817779 [Amylocystis lapponica]|nr:hypothetical protein B0H21DRAFT_817779 [Amylocystis lapponica]
MPDPSEASRLRLRYDLLAMDIPNILVNSPTNWSRADPTDGITNRIENELSRAPGGTINLKTRAIWRKCVRDRSNLTTKELLVGREEDMAEFYGMDREEESENGPLGGTAPADWLPKGQRSRPEKAVKVPKAKKATPRARKAVNKEADSEEGDGNESEFEAKAKKPATRATRKTVKKGTDPGEEEGENESKSEVKSETKRKRRADSEEEKRNAPAPQRVPVDHEPWLESTDEERGLGFNLDKLRSGGDTSHLVPPQEEKAQPSNITGKAPLDTEIDRLAALANQPSLKVNQVRTQDELAQNRQISSSVRSGAAGITGEDIGVAENRKFS